MTHIESTTDSPEEVKRAEDAGEKAFSGKIGKAEAGYQYHPDTEYRCEECVMIKDRDGGKGCAWFGPTVPISASSGSCNYFAHTHDLTRPEIPWIGLFTKAELGYLENAEGFSCKRCEELIVLRNDCKKVDRNSEGDTPGEISPYGCCNFWEADRKRAQLTTPELVQIMGGK